MKIHLKCLTLQIYEFVCYSFRKLSDRNFGHKFTDFSETQMAQKLSPNGRNNAPTYSTFDMLKYSFGTVYTSLIQNLEKFKFVVG